MQRLKGLMRASAGPKPIRETQEVNLVDGAQDLGHRPLNYLIFERGNAEWSLATVGLGNVHPPDWLRPVASRVNLRVKSLEVLRQLLLVVRHRLPIDSRSRASPESSERALQGTHINVMQQRRRECVEKCRQYGARSGPLDSHLVEL